MFPSGAKAAEAVFPPEAELAGFPDAEALAPSSPEAAGTSKTGSAGFLKISGGSIPASTLIMVASHGVLALAMMTNGVVSSWAQPLSPLLKMMGPLSTPLCATTSRTIGRLACSLTTA